MPWTWFLRMMALILMMAGAATGATLYVSPVGTNNALDKYPDWAGAATNIQWGANAATNGDVVLVTNTVYYLTTNIVVTNGITLRSWNNGNLDRTNTVLDGQHLVRCLYIKHTNALVAGFMITNGVGTGSVSSLNGGGVFIGSATGDGGCLSNCIVAGNSADSLGGGVYVYGNTLGAYAIVVDCEIRGNMTTDASDGSSSGGGGIYVNGGQVLNCMIAGNRSECATGNTSKGGGGIQVRSAVNTSVRGCVISNNTSMWYGGGVWLYETAGAFVGNTVSHNSAPANWGGGMGLYRTSANLVISDCIISYNTCKGDAGNGRGAGGVGLLLLAGGEGGLITNCVIQGNMVTNSFPGGGIYLSSSRTNYFTVANCTISGNSVSNSSGGGMFAIGYALIRNCVISSNSTTGSTAAYGGAGYLTAYPGLSQYPEVRNCLIYGNSSGYRCGGLSVQGPVESCTIAGNTAVDQGGGVRLIVGSTFTNTICYSNTAPAGSNWYHDGGGSFSCGCTTPTNGLTGDGNITNYPLFTDENACNYRLLPSSPCINTGANQDWMNSAVDLDGRPRLDRFSGRVDMGCYEHIRQGMVFMMH